MSYRNTGGSWGEGEMLSHESSVSIKQFVIDYELKISIVW